MRLSDILFLYRARLRARTVLVQECFAILGIAVGVALLFASQVASTSLTRSVAELSSQIVGNTRFQLDARGPDGFSEGLLREVRAVPGVRVALPVLEQQANVIGPAGERPVDLIGTDPRFAHFAGPLLRRFSATQLAAQQAIALPAPIAQAIGAGPLQTVQLQAGAGVVTHPAWRHAGGSRHRRADPQPGGLRAGRLRPADRGDARADHAHLRPASAGTRPGGAGRSDAACRGGPRESGAGRLRRDAVRGRGRPPEQKRGAVLGDQRARGLHVRAQRHADHGPRAAQADRRRAPARRDPLDDRPDTAVRRIRARSARVCAGTGARRPAVDRRLSLHAGLPLVRVPDRQQPDRDVVERPARGRRRHDRRLSGGVVAVARHPRAPAAGGERRRGDGRSLGCGAAGPGARVSRRDDGRPRAAATGCELRQRDSADRAGLSAAVPVRRSGKPVRVGAAAVQRRVADHRGHRVADPADASSLARDRRDGGCRGLWHRRDPGGAGEPPARPAGIRARRSTPAIRSGLRRAENSMRSRPLRSDPPT